MDNQSRLLRAVLSLSLVMGVIVVAPVANPLLGGQTADAAAAGASLGDIAAIAAVAAPAPIGIPVDCDNPATDETVVKTSADLENALLNVGGTIAVQPGVYPISVRTVQSARLTSCDFDNRAVISTSGVSGDNRAISSEGQGATMHVHNISFSMLGVGPTALNASRSTLFVADADFSHADGAAGGGQAVRFVNSTGGVSGSTFDFVSTAIEALSPGDLVIDNVIIRNASFSGINVRGKGFQDDQAEPVVAISNATVIASGRSSGDPFGTSQFEDIPGIRAKDIEVSIVDSQVGCGSGPNIGLIDPEDIQFFRAPQTEPVINARRSSVASNIGALPAARNADGSYVMTMDNVNVGFIEGPLAPAKCVNEGYGVLVDGAVDADISNSTIRGHASDAGLIVTKRARAGTLLSNVMVADNDVGVSHDAALRLTDSQVVNNGTDCVGDSELALINSVDSDDTCDDGGVGGGGGFDPDGSIDCDNPPEGTTVVPDDVDDLATAMFERGIIAMRSGTYSVSTTIPSGSVELTSCEWAQPAVVVADPKPVEIDEPALGGIIVTNGAQLNVNHVDMELSESGFKAVVLGADSGAELTVDTVRMVGTNTGFTTEEIGIGVANKATATIMNTEITRLGRGIELDGSGDVSMDFVNVTESAESGIWMQGTNDPASGVFNPNVVITNSSSTYSGQNLATGASIFSSDIDLTMKQTAVACNNNTGIELSSRTGQPATSNFDNVRIGVLFPPPADLVRNDLVAQAAAPCVNGDVGLSVVKGAAVDMSVGVVEMGKGLSGVVIGDAVSGGRNRFERTTIQNNGFGVDSDAPFTLDRAQFFDNEVDCAGAERPTLEGLVLNDGSCQDPDADPDLTISAVGGLSETAAGPRLRAEALQPIEFRVDASSPVAGEPLVVPWTFRGLTDVVPGYRALAVSEIRGSVGTVTIQPGETSATFAIETREIETLEHAGFQLRIGDGSEQSIDGIVIRKPEVEIGKFDGPFEIFPYQVVTEGNNIVWNLKMSPASPFLEDEYRVRWAFNDLGEPDAIDAGDIETTAGEVDFLFDAALADTPGSSTRTLIIPTIINAGDAEVESFFFDAEIYDPEDPTGSISLAGGVGQINDAGDPDPLPDLTIVAVDGLTGTFDDPVLRADVAQTVQIRVEAAEPVTGQPIEVPWTVSGRFGTVPGFSALPAEDITDTSGTVTLPVGATSATFDVMVAADNPGETAGFTMKIGDGPGQSIEGLLVGARSVSVAPTDPNGPRFDSKLVVAEGDPIEVDVIVSPADPFVDAAKTISWTLEPGAIDGIDADDVASVNDVFEIDFDPAGDGPEGSTRTVSIATETNTGDLSYETFVFNALLRRGDTGALALSGLDGGIADRIGTTISPVDALTDSTIGPVLRADVGERVQFRVDLDEPAVGGRSVPWQIFGEIGVVPGFRGIEADEITEQSGTVTIEPGASSTTFDVMVAATNPSETVGFKLRVGSGPSQQVTGLLVGIPALIGVQQSAPVNEGDPIEVEIRLSPANPFFDDADQYPWTLGPGAIDGIDADDVAAVSGNAEFVFDPATDTAGAMDRVVVIGTLRNTGDAPLESFEFEIESRNAEVSAEVLGAIGVSGQIADAPDNDDAPIVSVQPSDEWQLDLGDGVDAVVLIDGDDASSVEVSIDSPRATRTELTWAIEGTEVDGERAATTTGPGNDFQQITGTFAIPAGATSTTVFLRSEADATDEPHEGFTFTITSGAAEVVSIPGLIETDSFSVVAAPTDGDDDDLLIGVPAEGTIDATLTITPAPLLRTSFIQDWQLLGNGAFGDGPATAADFAATSGSLGLGIDAVLDGPGAALDSVTRELTIDVVDDGVAEPSEGFELALSANEGTEGQVLLGVIYDGAEPTAEEGTSFGGLKVADVKGDVESDENGPTGTARGKIKLPSFDDLELPVDIVFANGAVTVTYEDTLDDIDLSSGEGADAVQYLGLQAPAVKVQATATARGKVSAFVELSAETGTLFPNSVSIPIQATIDKPIVTINSNTVIVMSARAVSGTFEAVTVTGPEPVTVTGLQPRLIISPDPAVPLLTVDDITASGGLTLTGLKVFRDGKVEFDEACVDPNNWLNGSLDVIGLPLSIDTACVFSNAEGTRAKITGSLDEGALAPLDATITIGDGATNTVDALFDIKGPAITPRDLGPIKITLNEFETNGYTASGFFTIQGYKDGVLNPNFSGEFTIGTPEGDTVDSNVSGNITSTGNGLSATTLVDVFLDVAFEGAADNPGLDSDLLTVDDASLGLNFGIETTETTVINEAVASTGGLLDLFDPNAPSNDPTNAYVLAVLNHYLYLDSYGLTPTPTDAQFADVLRPVVEGFGGELVDFFVGDQGVQGAIIRTDTALIVVGRGSDTLQDYTLQAVGALPNSNGEHRAVAEAADVMQDAITAALADRGSRALWFTGHSYGGALASIIVGRMQGTVDIDGLVTFGAPAPFTAERVAAEATDPTSALMRATRWDNQSDPIPLLYVPGLYFHQNDPNRIVVAPDGVCSIEPTFLDLTTDVDADDHSIARYALRLLNLSAPADRTAILSTQRDDLTVTVVPIADVPADSTANCDAAQPFTKATTTSIIGPVVTSAGAGIVLRIPGLTDDAGQAIEIGATVSFDNGVWTAEAVLDPEVAYRFGGFRLNDLTGDLEVDTNTGAATPILGSFTASIVIPAAEGEPIPIDVSLDFETNAAGVLTANVAGSLEFTGELFGGALAIDSATLDVTGAATFDAADIASSTLAVTALLDLKGAKLELGAFEVVLGDVAFNYDGDPATPLFSAATIEGRIADPNDPTKTLLGVTITGLVLNDDGTVNVNEINVRNLDDLQREFALAGVLPYIVSEITLTTTNGDFNAFTLDVEGDVDLTVFDPALDVRFSATTGDPAVAVPSSQSCDSPDDPDGPTKEFPLNFSIDVTSARDFQFAPKDLSNIFLGVCNLQVGPFTAQGSIELGGYVDGEFQGDVSGSFGITVDPGNGGSLSASATVTGDMQFPGNGAALLAVDANFTASGKIDDVVEINDASIDLSFDVGYDPAASPIVEFANFSIDGGSVGSVKVELGDYVTLESSGAKLFPEPGVLVSVVGPPNGSDDDDDAGNESAFFSAKLGDDLGALAGWSGRAGGFKIVTDTPGSLTGIDVELHPGFFVEITVGDGAQTGFPEWLPFVIREAGISWPELGLTNDGLTVNEPVRLRDLVTNIGEAEILFSGGISSEGSPWPIDAQVDGLRIDIGALTRFVAGTPRTGDSIIKGLDAVKIGMEPTEFGPLTIGGAVSIGSVDVPDSDPIFYIQVQGAFGLDDIELSGQLVISEYGPVALEFSAPLAVPLGPSGFVLSGVSGGVDFLSEFGPKTVCPADKPDCPRQAIQVDCEAEAVGKDGEEGLTCNSGPLDLLDDQAFPIGEFTFDPADLAADIASRLRNPLPLLPEKFTVRLGGKLTHIGAAGVISGDVNLAINLDIAETAKLKILGSGTISAAGVKSGAEARFLIDLAEPFEPVFTVAMQIPTQGDWIADVLPIQAQVGITVDTEGLAPGMVMALRQFVTESTTNSAVFTDVVIPRLAAVLEVDHSLASAQLLLDIDNNGDVSPTEDAVVITGQFVLDRLDQLLVTFVPGEDGIGEVLANDIDLALRVTAAFISDLFSVVDGRLIEQLETKGIVFEPLTDQEIADFFADFLETAQVALVGDGTPGNTGALGTLLTVANPKLLIQGQMEIKAFGLPIGSRKAVTVYLDKTQLIFDATGSIWETLRSGCGIPGCSEGLYLAFLGLNDTTTASVSVPFDLQGLLTGGDVIRNDWAVGLSSELSAFGLPLGTATGFVVPAGNRTFVDLQIDATLPGGEKKFVIPVSPEQRAVIAENGGVMFEGNLRLPNFITNPANVVRDLGGKCTTVPEALLEIPAWITDCFDIATQTDPVGAVQAYLPAPNFEAFNFGPNNTTKVDDVLDEIGDQLSVAYIQGTLGNPDANGDGKVDDAEEAEAEAEPFRILGLPLGQMEVSASTKGLSVTGDVPILGSPATFDIILPESLDNPASNYPRVGATLELDSDGVQRAVNGLGFGQIIDLEGIKATGSFKAYSPGFDTTEDATPLQRSGGIEIKLTANIAIPGVVDIDNARIFVQITPSAKGILNITASVSVASVEVGGFTVTDAEVEFSLVDGTASGSLRGSVKLPSGFSDGTGKATVTVNGSFAEGEFDLKIAANSLKVGPVSLSGALSIEGSAGVATIAVGPVPNASAAMISIDGLATVRTTGMSVSSDGRFSVNVAIPDLGGDRLELTGLDVTVSGSPTGPDGYRLNLQVEEGAELTIKPLASVQETKYEIPAFKRTLSLDDLAFSRTIRIPAIELGSFMQTSNVQLTLALEDGVLSLTQDGKTAAGGLIPGTITVLGASAKIVGLKIATDGTVEGQVFGDLTVFGNTLAGIRADITQVNDRRGNPVLKLNVAGEMKLPKLDNEIAFAGYVQSDGEFEVRGLASAAIATPAIRPGSFLGFELPEIPPLNLASFDGSATLTNVGGLSGSVTARVCIIDACARASGQIDSNGVVSGFVTLGTERPRTVRFVFPLGARLAGTPNVPAPEFIDTKDDIFVQAATAFDLAVSPQSAPTKTVVPYELPRARNATSVFCSPASGAEFDIGTTVVRCEASGEFQSAYTQFRVTVRTLADFELAGIPTPSPNITSAGVTLPNTPSGQFIVQPGQEIKGQSGPFEPKSTVKKVVLSDPIELGSETAGADGILNWTVTIPAELPVGAHTLVFSGVADGIQVLYTVPLEVRAAPVVPGGGLPATGSSGTSTIVWLAVLLMLLGSVLLVGRRRRGPRITIA